MDPHTIEYLSCTPWFHQVLLISNIEFPDVFLNFEFPIFFSALQILSFQMFFLNSIFELPGVFLQLNFIDVFTLDLNKNQENVFENPTSGDIQTCMCDSFGHNLQMPTQTFK